MANMYVVYADMFTKGMKHLNSALYVRHLLRNS